MLNSKFNGASNFLRNDVIYFRSQNKNGYRIIENVDRELKFPRKSDFTNHNSLVKSILRNGNIESYKIKLSNGGVDLMGNHVGKLLLIQCKNYTERKVTKAEVRELEGVLSKYPENTIGVFCGPL
ncbi:hypothetical protein Glove_364g18 [Diversispora epigaea]|uniref:Restriction endonuclease type IV Mrr domain-containing protein n=1 Tax=Diversispora epigaea TaxID=1348612 RepID=A0A397HDF9_9GLOM|nr:hypothetical protein Glove_364g18 [Diversispora epigaea]